MSFELVSITDCVDEACINHDPVFLTLCMITGPETKEA